MSGSTSSGTTITLSDSTGLNSAALSSNDSINLKVGSATFNGGTAATSATPSVYTVTVNPGATATGSLTVAVKTGSSTVGTASVNVTAGDASTVAGKIATVKWCECHHERL